MKILARTFSRTCYFIIVSVSIQLLVLSHTYADCVLNVEDYILYDITVDLESLCKTSGSKVDKVEDKIAAPPINSSGRIIDIYTTLLRKEKNIGTVLLRIDTADRLSLDAKGITDLLSGWLKPEVLVLLNANAERGRLTQKSFLAVGLSMSFDANVFELTLEIPDDFILDKNLNLSKGADNRKYLRPTSFSGYLNLLAGSSYQKRMGDEPDTENYGRSVELESVIRSFSTALEVEARYDKPEQKVDAQFYRKNTRIVHDFPASSTRLVVGDIFTLGSHFQDSVDMLGVGLTRNFNLIPTRNVRPTAGRSFTLIRASDVDIIVNGAMVRRLSLEAGTYNLSDIPLTAGSNDVELVIEDASGKVERIYFTVATGQDLLAAGEFDYTVATGILTSRAVDGPEYDSDVAVASAELRIGLAPWFTLGLNAQGRDQIIQLGSSTLIATSVGTLGASLSGSHIEYIENGYATGLSFDANFGKENTHQQRLTFRTEFLSETFSGIAFSGNNSLGEETEPFNNVEAVADISYSQQLTGSLQGGVSFGFSSQRQPASNQYSIGASLSGKLFSTSASWSLHMTTEQNNVTGEETSTFFSLHIPLGKFSRVTVDGQVPNGSVRSKYFYSRAAGRVGGISTYLVAENSKNYEANLGAGIDYTANRFHTSLDHDSRFTELQGEQRDHVTRLRLDTGFAFAGTNFAFGRPVKSSFAIINRHPSLVNNSLHIDQKDDGSLVNSDGLGNLLVSDLGLYRGRLLNYDVENLPPGYDLGDGVFAVSPPYMAGYSLQIGSDATITVLGTLIDASSSEPLGLVGGEARHLSDTDFETIFFFSNRKGRFAISGVKPGEYELKLAMRPVRSYILVVDSDAKALLRVGEIRVN